jgi:hypothetical protein
VGVANEVKANAGPVAKSLLEFIHPGIMNSQGLSPLGARPKMVKSVKRQMREIHGHVAFNKGYYHSQHYEQLIKSLTNSRVQYRYTKHCTVLSR